MNFDQKTKEQICNLFSAYDKPDSPGFAIGITYQNELIFGKGFGQANLEHPSPINIETIFDVGSNAKQFTAMCIALLEEQKLLSRNDPIQNYLPDFPDYASKVTIKDLLHHCSGLRNYTVLAYFIIGYHESDAIRSEEIYELLKRVRSLNFEPGERYEYCDSNYFLLAKIVKAVSGMRFSQFAKENIFNPLDMKQTLFRDDHSQVIRNRAIGYVSHPVKFESPFTFRPERHSSNDLYSLTSNYEHLGAEGLFTNILDISKWLSNFSDNQLGNKDQNLIKKMITPGFPRKSERGYGYGLAIRSRYGKKSFGHDGGILGYTASFTTFPEELVSVICMSNHSLEGTWVYQDKICRTLFPDDEQAAVTAKPRETKPLPSKLGGFVGKYQNPENAAIWEILIKNHRLLVKENDDWEFELEVKGENHFHAVQENLDVEFRIESKNVETKIKARIGDKQVEFIPFLRSTAELNFSEFEGEYYCDELQTSFLVNSNSDLLLLRNKNRHFCSMDLNYSTTIADHFIAYDPHPGSSHINFLRSNGNVSAFTYQDYDGDGREEFVFKKVV